jgi:hypothetical protein
LVLPLAMAFAAADVHAQGRRQGGWPAHYNVAAEMTVKGTVEDLKPGPPGHARDAENV